MMPTPPPEDDNEYRRLEHRDPFQAKSADPAGTGDPGATIVPAVGYGIDKPVAPDHPGRSGDTVGLDEPDGASRASRGGATADDEVDTSAADRSYRPGEPRVDVDYQVGGDPNVDTRSFAPADAPDSGGVGEPSDAGRTPDASGAGPSGGAYRDASYGSAGAASEPTPVTGLDAGRAAQPFDYRSDSDVADPDLAGEAPYRPATPLGAESDGAGEAQDVVDVLVADHREVERLFAELEAATGDPQRRQDLVNVVVAELMRHSAAEEQYLYPAARRHLSDGDRIADHEIAEHARAEELMKSLLKQDGDDDSFDQLVTKLMSEIRHHIEEEETDLFPKLRQSCDRQTLVDVGTEIISAKRLAPTRPHPAAPDTPPFNKVTGPLAGLVDRAVDALTDRPTSVDDLTDRNR